jgi:hypothetical protein
MDARWAMRILTVSVLPAPDSPLTRMLWFRVLSLTPLALRHNTHTHKVPHGNVRIRHVREHMAKGEHGACLPPVGLCADGVDVGLQGGPVRGKEVGLAELLAVQVLEPLVGVHGDGHVAGVGVRVLAEEPLAQVVEDGGLLLGVVWGGVCEARALARIGRPPAAVLT